MNFDLTRRHFIHNSKICIKHVNSPIIYHYKLSRTRTAGGFFKRIFELSHADFEIIKLKEKKLLYFFDKRFIFSDK